eukprot:8705634-Pyramimonas_sp.AAC.1
MHIIWRQFTSCCPDAPTFGFMNERLAFNVDRAVGCQPHLGSSRAASISKPHRFGKAPGPA